MKRIGIKFELRYHQGTWQRRKVEAKESEGSEFIIQLPLAWIYMNQELLY